MADPMDVDDPAAEGIALEPAQLSADDWVTPLGQAGWSASHSSHGVPPYAADAVTSSPRRRYLGSRYQDWIEKILEQRRKRQEDRLFHLSQRLIGQHPSENFTKNFKSTISSWISLLEITTLPKGIASSDPLITVALKEVDSYICRSWEGHLMQRLAYIQLLRLFTCIEGVIRAERKRGEFFGAAGCQDASVAMNIYITAQEPHADLNRLRRQLKERKRTARRWAELSKPSPLFVLVYSKASDSIV